MKLLLRSYKRKAYQILSPEFQTIDGLTYVRMKQDFMQIVGVDKIPGELRMLFEIMPLSMPKIDMKDIPICGYGGMLLINLLFPLDQGGKSAYTYDIPSYTAFRVATSDNEALSYFSNYLKPWLIAQNSAEEACAALVDFQEKWKNYRIQAATSTYNWEEISSSYTIHEFYFLLQWHKWEESLKYGQSLLKVSSPGSALIEYYEVKKMVSYLQSGDYQTISDILEQNRINNMAEFQRLYAAENLI